MKTQKKVVYAVESGDYSDYRVHALFENKADAERAKTLYRKDAEIVTREVYEAVPPATRYFAIDRVGRNPIREHEYLVPAWDGQPWVGRMRNGVAFSKWPYGVRVWGTDEAGVRRRWEQFLAEEAEEKASVPDPLVIRA